MAGDAWNAIGQIPAASTQGVGIMAVRVPASGEPPVFDETVGIPSGDGFRLARLNLEAADRYWPNNAMPGALRVDITVNGLTITRVDSTGMPTPPWDLFVGHTIYGVPVPAEGGDADEQWATGTAAVIEILMKGDYNKDGSVTNLDIQPWLDARAAPTDSHNPNDLWLGDFNCSGTITGLDISGFLANRALP